MSKVHSPVSSTQLLISIVLYKPDLAKLVQCLQSIVDSRGVTLRVEILDNSPDPLPADYIAQYIEPQSLINYTHGGINVGFGAAHNQTFKRAHPGDIATAPYTLVLNPDAYFGSTLLADMVANMEADPRIGLAIPKIANPDGSIQLVNKRVPTPAILFLRPFIARSARMKLLLATWLRKYLLQDMDLNRPIICPFISGCFMFFRTDLLLQLKGFDERYFLYMEDLDLSRRAASKSLTVIFSQLTCNHHWERAAYKNRKLFRILITSGIKYFNKWGWLSDSEGKSFNRNVRYYTNQ